MFRPIKINAGAVASFGIKSATGVNSSINRNITAAASAVRPVLPPASAAAGGFNQRRGRRNTNPRAQRGGNRIDHKRAINLRHVAFFIQ